MTVLVDRSLPPPPCVVCESPVNEDGPWCVDSAQRIASYPCPQCGDFRITWEAQALLPRRLEGEPHLRAVLSHHIRALERVPGQPPVTLTMTMIEEMLTRGLPPPNVRATNLIRWIGDNTRVGQDVDVDPIHHLAVVGCLDASELRWVVDQLAEDGLLRCRHVPRERVLKVWDSDTGAPTTRTEHYTAASVSLTMSGWSRVRVLKEGPTLVTKGMTASPSAAGVQETTMATVERTQLRIPRKEAERQLSSQVAAVAPIQRIVGPPTDRTLLSKKDLQQRESAELRAEHEAHAWHDRNEVMLENMFTTMKVVEDYRRVHNGDFDATVALMTMTANLRLLPKRLGFLDRLMKTFNAYEEAPQVSGRSPGEHINPTGRDVFVIYGHDEGMKQTVARCLEKLKLKPILLDEEADEGNTIIEKFLKHSPNAVFALALLSPDDACGEKKRARQNVIFEMGYFVGKLGRERVRALYHSDVELPSDLHGVLYITYDHGGGWKAKLVKEMKAAGIAVSLDDL